MKTIRPTFLASLAGVFLLNTALVSAEGAKIVLGTKVEKHIMQNERDNFASHDGHVWAQIDLKPSTDGHVTFVWTRDGHPYSEFKATTAQGDRYRTHAYVTARPGKWHLAVMSEANVVLAEKDFVVDGDASHPHDAAHANTLHKADAAKETKPAMGITEALKAINPTDTKSEEKAVAKSHATSEKHEEHKQEEHKKEEHKKEEPAKVAAKLADSSMSAAHEKSADAKVNDAKLAAPKA